MIYRLLQHQHMHSSTDPFTQVPDSMGSMHSMEVHFTQTRHNIQITDLYLYIYIYIYVYYLKHNMLNGTDLLRFANLLIFSCPMSGLEEFIIAGMSISFWNLNLFSCKWLICLLFYCGSIFVSFFACLCEFRHWVSVPQVFNILLPKFYTCPLPGLLQVFASSSKCWAHILHFFIIFVFSVE
jgi:hypothetical protein